MDVDNLQSLLSQSDQNIQKGMGDLPNVENTARTQLYGSDPTLDSLRSAEAGKLGQLYEHDKQLSQKYASGQFGLPDSTNTAPPSGGVDNTGLSQGQINDPSQGWKGILNPYSADVNRAQQSKNTADELGTLQAQEAKRRDVLGSALDKVMKIAQSHVDLEKTKHDSLLQQLQMAMQERSSGLSTLMSVLEKAGGNITASMAQKYNIPTELIGTHIPGLMEQKKLDQAATPEGQAVARLTAEAKKGVTFTDLYNRYAGELKPSQIRQVYNDVNYYHKAATEDDNTLLSQYGQAKKGGAAASKKAEYSATAQAIRGQIDGIPLDKYAGAKAQTAAAKAHMGPLGTYLMTPDEKVSANLQSLLDTYFTTAVSTMSSRGVTAPDLKALDALKPTATMDPTVLQNRLDAINTLVSSKTGAGAAATGGSVNRQDVVTKLKSAHYTDDEIHAYLKAKGIDK